MPQLQEDFSALDVNGIGDCAPTIDLRLRIDPGGVLITLTLSRNLCSFADQQAGAGALAVIGGREFTGQKALACAVACQRCENDAVRQREATKGVRGEQVLVGHLEFLPCPLMEIGGAFN